MRQILFFIVMLFALVFFVPQHGMAHGTETGSLKIHHPWTRATPKGADVAGGFMVIDNRGDRDDRLINVEVSGVKRAEIHEMSMDNGVMKMRPLTSGLLLPAGKSITLKPGGFHIMMMGLSSPLLEGDYIKAVLTFENAGRVEIEFVVEAQGANLKQHDMNHTP